MHSSGDEALMWLAVFVVGVALILWASIFLGILWFLISGVVAAHRYRKYLKEANTNYDQVEAEAGTGLDADDIFRSVFGSDINLPQDGHENPLDWVEDSVFGFGQKE